MTDWECAIARKGGPRCSAQCPSCRMWWPPRKWDGTDGYVGTELVPAYRTVPSLLRIPGCLTCARGIPTVPKGTRVQAVSGAKGAAAPPAKPQGAALPLGGNST